MQTRPKPVVLAILDGWGHSDNPSDNAIYAARTPVWERLLQNYPSGLLSASALDVGLPDGQMGNSEVGHMNIGSGRVVMQDLPRIDQAIASGSLQTHPELLQFIAALKASGGTCHMLGLLSDGGVHSHQHHIAALARTVAAQGVPVAVHAFLDGRDTPPKSALGYVKRLEADVAGHDVSIASLGGRYFGMDRDKRWERVEKAYRTISQASGARFDSAQEAIEDAYASGITDEFIEPCVVGAFDGIKDGDGLVMANFRADRARQILSALLDPAFEGFKRTAPRFQAALGMAEYSQQHAKWLKTLFPPESLSNILPEVIANAGLTQLRIAETEKYAHVTFFFSGGRETPFDGETRILIPSPSVATYDLKPEMSAPEVTDALVEAINAERFDFIVVNYANTDMVGHTGNLKAAIAAVEAVDSSLGRVVEAALAKGGAVVISADHGNAEMMHDHTEAQPHTAHTLNLVPVVIVSGAYEGQRWQMEVGKLADLAPTVLDIMNLPIPAEMGGKSLIPIAIRAKAANA